MTAKTDRLFLFDIDGTILSTNRSGYRSFIRIEFGETLSVDVNPPDSQNGQVRLIEFPEETIMHPQSAIPAEEDLLPRPEIQHKAEWHPRKPMALEF